MNFARTFLVALLFAFAVNCADFYGGLTFKSLNRNIDLTTQVVQQTVNITLLNSGNTEASLFYFTIPQAEHLASISASNEGGELSVKKVDDVKGLPSTTVKFATYEVKLRKPLASQGTESVSVSTEFTHLVQAYPTTISQADRQFVRYFDNHYFFTPYTVQHQRSTVLVASAIESKSELAPTQVKGGNTVVYGPYDNTAPFAVSELFVHFENNSPFVTITRWDKLVEVSHWGNVAVENDFDLQHDGAKLKGTFSRFDYQRQGAAPSAVRQLSQVLPLAANEIYYRDEIGNISTSTLVPTESGLEFVIEPRFPLFGGWKTSYYTGYNLPAAEALGYSVKDSSLYVLTVAVAEAFDSAVVDSLTVRVVLPEGASDIKVQAPFQILGEERSTHYTYLDTAGRPVAIFKRVNFVPTGETFQVTYRFSQTTLLREPLMLVATFFAFFAVIMVVVRVNLRLTPLPPKPAHADKVNELLEEVAKLSKQRATLVSNLESANSSFVNNQLDAKAYNNEKKKVEAQLGAVAIAMLKVVGKIEAFDGSVAAKVRELNDKELARVKAVQDKHQNDVAFQQSTINATTHADNQVRLDAALKKAEEDVETLVAELTGDL